MFLLTQESMSELVITQDKLLNIRDKYEPTLFNDIIGSIKILTSQESNYWNVTSFINAQQENLSMVDKVQFVSLFMYLGGTIEYSNIMHHFIDHANFWTYLLEHRIISHKEDDYLRNHFLFGEDGRILRHD